MKDTKKKAQADLDAVTKVNATAAKTEDVLERVTDTLTTRPVGMSKDATTLDVDLEQARQVYHNGDNAVAKEMQAEVKVRRDIAHDVDSAAQTARQNKIDSVKDAKHTSWKQMPIVENIVNSDPAAEVAKVKAEKLKEDAAKKRDAEARKENLDHDDDSILINMCVAALARIAACL